MRNRPWTWPLALALLLLPALATAGGGGHMFLSRPVDRVAAGTTEIYLQALQHDVHPVSDATVTVVGKGPNGAAVTAAGTLENAWGTDNVYKVLLPLDQVGDWKLTINAKSMIFFPPLDLTVQVLPAGTQLPAPGPVKPFHSAAGDGHDHTVTAAPPQQAVSTPAPTQAPATPVQTAPDPAPAASAPAATVAAPAATSPIIYWMGAAALAVALAGAGLLLWRRANRRIPAVRGIYAPDR